MQTDEVSAEAERLVTSLQTIRAPTQTVYDITEKLVDTLPDDIRNPVADSYVNFAYDELLRADKLINMGRHLLEMGVYPRYTPDRRYWVDLETHSDQQRARLDHHLRFVCLRDSDDLEPRRDAALAVIDGMLDIYQLRNALFYLLDRGYLSTNQIRLAEGVIELSVDFVETIAGVVRRSTQVAPRR